MTKIIVELSARVTIDEELADRLLTNRDSNAVNELKNLIEDTSRLQQVLIGDIYK